MRPLLDVYGSYEWETGLFEPLYIPGESIQARAIGPAIRRLKDTLTALKGVSFRSDKRLSKVVAELDSLTDRHEILSVSFMDNLLPPKNLKTLFESLAGLRKDLRFFAEIRATHFS